MAEMRKSQSLWGDAWRRLRRNKAAMVGLVIVPIMSLLAITADWVIPPYPASATRKHSRTPRRPWPRCCDLGAIARWESQPTGCTYAPTMDSIRVLMSGTHDRVTGVP